MEPGRTSLRVSAVVRSKGPERLICISLLLSPESPAWLVRGSIGRRTAMLFKEVSMVNCVRPLVAEESFVGEAS